MTIHSTIYVFYLSEHGLFVHKNKPQSYLKFDASKTPSYSTSHIATVTGNLAEALKNVNQQEAQIYLKYLRNCDFLQLHGERTVFNPKQLELKTIGVTYEYE